MKSILRLLAIGLVILGTSVGAADAFSLGGYQGPVLIHLSGLESSAIYPVGTLCAGGVPCAAAAIPPGLPIPGGTSGPVASPGPFGGESAWGIFRVTSITDLALTPLWVPSATEELTGIFYNVYDVAVTTVVTTTEIRSVGGVLGPSILADIYLDSTPDASTAGGPLARCGFGCYPTYTDGAAFLNLAFVPGADAAAPFAQLASDFDPATSSGDATGFANITGGGYASWFIPGQILTNIFTLADVKLVFDVLPVVPAGTCGPGDPLCLGASPWTVAYNDPATAFIPEPSSLLLLGSSLLALGGVGYLRRRS